MIIFTQYGSEPDLIKSIMAAKKKGNGKLVKKELPGSRNQALTDTSGQQNPLLTDMFRGSVNPTEDLRIRANRDRFQQANFFGGLPNQNLYDLKRDPEKFDRFFDYSQRRGAKLRRDTPDYMLRYNPEVNQPFRTPLGFSVPDAINRTSVGAPQVSPDQLFADGGLLPNQYGLPEYGFGSFLKKNLGTIGSLVSAIPIVGNIAGPVLSGVGSFLNAQDQAKGDQGVLDDQAAAQAEEQRVTDLNTRRTNIVDDKQINYGATFQDGGPLGQGFTGQPQITEYSNGNSHQEGIGGIPVDARGNPSTTSEQSAVGLTEKGEVTWNGYVFSDKLKTK